jgi:hypothetical protein
MEAVMATKAQVGFFAFLLGLAVVGAYGLYDGDFNGEPGVEPRETIRVARINGQMLEIREGTKTTILCRSDEPSRVGLERYVRCGAPPEDTTIRAGPLPPRENP